MANVTPLVPLQSNEITELNRLILQLNEIHSQIATALASMTGEDGATPTFSNHIDMGGKRIMGAGRAQHVDEVPTLGQVKALIKAAR